jgi:hypothetical protein
VFSLGFHEDFVTRRLSNLAALVARLREAADVYDIHHELPSDEGRHLLLRVQDAGLHPLKFLLMPTLVFTNMGASRSG